MNDIDVVVWLTYFGLGFLLLAALLWAQVVVRRLQARRAKVDQTMIRMSNRPKARKHLWGDEAGRGIR